MKKVTYTQMRAELSDILELIRNGETVVITQRGKPDTKINGSIIVSEGESVNKKQKIAPAVKTSVVDVDSLPSDMNAFLYKFDALAKSLQPSPEVIEGMQRMANQLNAIVNSPEMRQLYKKANDTINYLNSNSEAFKKALLHTQTKHADIIKALEDK
ncbi:type II toxin-antitoxin system Phd/YefM family antitoxin [Xenorhabdus bovienii]|uniref:type II toxin-antitoxin system Phd/YefM family antitoxin n=1 Tax=Xenorhabdus bovienii TaxID=40576 RepID=UPI0023B342AB|nr:type II toxin-antitoxin system prevent-host-death family antitoxin [Xenorhabdus bovienii]MDE9543729.1 type II toxin-antitoxin system prevent-host-death family antitoxin [Xenorhabdus bovienii]